MAANIPHSAVFAVAEETWALVLILLWLSEAEHQI
jgi:hypothetical protein